MRRDRHRQRGAVPAAGEAIAWKGTLAQYVGRLHRRHCEKKDVLVVDYVDSSSTSRATATRDLHDLVEQGALIRTGERRHTRYRLNLPNPTERA